MAIIIILFLAFIALYVVSRFIYEKTDYIKTYCSFDENKWVAKALNDISDLLSGVGLAGIIINACLLLWKFVTYLVNNGTLQS